MNATFEIQLSEAPDKSYTYFQIFMDGHQDGSGVAFTPHEALKKIAAYLTRECRQCGCTLLNACDLGDKTCEWVKPDLCSGCKPKSGRKQKHRVNRKS